MKKNGQFTLQGTTIMRVKMRMKLLVKKRKKRRLPNEGNLREAKDGN